MSETGELRPTPKDRQDKEIDLRNRVQSRMAADRARVEQVATAQIEEMAGELTKTHEQLARTWSRQLSDDLSTTSRAIKHDLQDISLTSAKIRRRAMRMAWWPIGAGILIALVLIGSGLWIRATTSTPPPPFTTEVWVSQRDDGTWVTTLTDPEKWTTCKGEPCRKTKERP